MKLKMMVAAQCPMCGETSHIVLEGDEVSGYMAYNALNILLQDAFPAMDAPSREFVKTGYCKECMKMLFGRTSDRIEPGMAAEAVEGVMA